jgi:hypothetical protein
MDARLLFGRAATFSNIYPTCAAAFGTRKQMLITSTIIVLPLAMILIVLALVLSLVAALIPRYPFAVAAARSPL